MKKNLFNNVWDAHVVGTLDSGQDQLFVGLHLIHEVTSPQAFDMLRERGLAVRHPERTFATVDHIVPTDIQRRPLQDPLAEEMMQAIERNCQEHGITFFGLDTPNQGVVHIVGPEQGLTQPGMTIVCGDSHTATHGAFGAIAFGIGTSQIRDVLATQTIAMTRPKVRRINVTGELPLGVSAKDIILRIIADLGVNGGIGYAYEFNGDTIMNLSMEERMTICNMSIEGGARVGYINPDQTTYDYLRNRPYAPKEEDFNKAIEYWESLISPEDAEYDDWYDLDATTIEPMVTWGITPGQAVGITKKLPTVKSMPEDEREVAKKAYDYTGFTPKQSLIGQGIDVAFIGSCTNGRISDLRAAAAVIKGKTVHPDVRALVVPGSKRVAEQAELEGLDRIFEEAGFLWRKAGCSMCLAMNDDKLKGREICASSSNRNFMGRQGSATGRTILMSPSMVAIAAIHGQITDIREVMGEEA